MLLVSNWLKDIQIIERSICKLARVWRRELYIFLVNVLKFAVQSWESVHSASDCELAIGEAASHSRTWDVLLN